MNNIDKYKNNFTIVNETSYADLNLLPDSIEDIYMSGAFVKFTKTPANLRNLKVVMYEEELILTKSTKLEKLILIGSFSQDFIINDSVKYLELGSDIYKKVTLHNNIKHLSIKCYRKYFNNQEHIIPTDLISLELHRDDSYIIPANLERLLLADGNHKYMSNTYMKTGLSKLKNLILVNTDTTGGFSYIPDSTPNTKYNILSNITKLEIQNFHIFKLDLSEYTNIKHICFSGKFNQKTCKLPKTLEIFEIKKVDVKIDFNLLPKSLVVLLMSDCDLTKLEELENLKSLLCLKILAFISCTDYSNCILSVDLPDSLEVLKIYNKDKYSGSHMNISLNTKLEYLEIRMYKNLVLEIYIDSKSVINLGYFVTNFNKDNLNICNTIKIDQYINKQINLKQHIKKDYIKYLKVFGGYRNTHLQLYDKYTVRL